MALTDREIAIVKGMLARGDRQHHIAAYFGENSARVNEIHQATRGIGAGIAAAPAADLPPPGPYMVGRSSVRARETLEALRDLITQSLEDIDRFEKKAERENGEA